MSCLHLIMSYTYHVRRHKARSFCHCLFFGLMFLNWHGYRERFYCRVVFSGIDLLHVSMEYLLLHSLEHFLLYNMHSRLSAEWCFQVEDVRDVPVCGSTASIIPTYVPQNQMTLACLPTHVMLGDRTLCSFW